MVKTRDKWTERTIRPTRKTLGGFVEMSYTKIREYRGLKWYLTDFSDGSNREDFVADVTSISLSVSRYMDEKTWTHGKHQTWEDAADDAMERSLSQALSDLRELESKACKKRSGIAQLEKATSDKNERAAQGG